jgi:hypothetical protein
MCCYLCDRHGILYSFALLYHSIALKKLQSLLDHPAQYKARLNELVSLQRIQENVPPSLPNQLCPEDLEKIYMVSF